MEPKVVLKGSSYWHYEYRYQDPRMGTWFSVSVEDLEQIWGAGYRIQSRVVCTEWEEANRGIA